MIQGNAVVNRLRGETFNDSSNSLAFRRLLKAPAPGTLEQFYSFFPSTAGTEIKSMELGVG